MSIRLRLTLWYTALLSVVLAAFAVLVYVVAAQQLTSQLEYAVHLQALEASRTVDTDVLSGPITRAHRLQLPAAVAFADRRLYIQLVGVNGDVLAKSGDLGQPLPTPQSSLRTALGGEESHITLNLPGERVDLYSAPLLLDDRVVGILQVAASLRPLEDNLGRIRLILLAVVLGTAGFAAALGWFLAAKAMRPVDRLTMSAQAIGRSGDLARRLAEPTQNDELGRLAATFNEMLGRVDRVVATQRRFLADAAHELRTPVTSIRTNVEALLRTTRLDPRERDVTLRAVARESERMTRLLNDLLALAHADAGQVLARRRVALDTVLLEAYQLEKALADGVRLDLGELEQVEVEGDQDRLKQLILNLVDNALRYTPSGGSVTLDLVHRAGWAELRVRDTGPGIPAENLPRIFERFYRFDQPGARHTGGTGLGLAICRWIAEAHGGRVEAASQEGVGSAFTVFLPTAGPSGGDSSTIPSSTRLD